MTKTVNVNLNKKLVFVCSPLSGNINKNIENTKKYCKYIINNYNDVIPIAPHIYFTQFLNDNIPYERDLGIECGLQLLKMCSDIYVFVDHTFVLSKGMEKEVDFAIKSNISVHYVEREKIK